MSALPPTAVAPSAVLTIRDLSKSFGPLKAVDAVSLDVDSGEIYGFLGPNGAGKTTTLKMILGLTYPDQGRVLIDGMDLSDRPHEIKRRTGYLPEIVAFYENLTALQNLEFFASLKGVEKDGLPDLLESVGLRRFADKKVRTFSKGMVQLLGVAQALMGEPRLLLLDEPTAGLDPNWTRAVKDRIREANKNGASVFFSSHILSEVQELATRVGILNKGKLLAEDTVQNLGTRLAIKPRLRISLDVDPAEGVRVLESLDGVEETRTTGAELIVVCEPRIRPRVLSQLEKAGIQVTDFHTEDPSLEEVFLRYTEDSRREV